MIILKQCERIAIVTTEEDIVSGKIGRNTLKILFQGRTYDNDKGGFKCIIDEEQRPLYPNLRNDFTENVEDAKLEFERLHKFFGKSEPQPQPQPQVPAGNFADELQKMMLKVLAEQSVDKVLDLAKPLLNDHIIKTFGVLPQVHEIKGGKVTKQINGTVHEIFDTVLQLVNLDIPVFLTGQAGTGKNVICKQIAEALDLEFYFTNAVTQEYQIKGFIDANGRFHETQFFKAFTNGGLFFLDEMDGSIPETLIMLNSAIANRYFDFPTGKVEAHPDFRIISAGNTIGTGADIEYTGRFQLDASSLDRFQLIRVGYSPSIEHAVSNGNEELCQFARTFREVTEQASIRCLFTYRSIERIAKLEEILPLHEVIQGSLTKGLRKDDIKIIVRNMNKKGLNNKYTRALTQLA